MNMNSKRFEDKLIKPVYDNIYGFIYLTREEKKLLSSPYLQRLNLIKQNSLSYFVFPGATHTRLSHSLGVLNITERLIQKLKKTRKIEITETAHTITRLAALLHDIGHYPLSHTIEASYMETNQAKKADNVFDSSKNIIMTDIPTISSFLESTDRKKDKRFNHERIAEKIIKTDSFKQELKNAGFNLREMLLNIIGAFITGDKAIIESIEDEEKRNMYFILSQLIHSDFDADQMDYMIRDTVNTGIKSSLRLDFIINNLNICNKKLSNESIRPSICFNSNAIQSIEQFLLAKFYWYSEILYYDKVAIMNLIAQRIYSFLLTEIPDFAFKHDYLIGKEKGEDNQNILINNPEKYFFFNDNAFWEQINKILCDEISAPPLIKTLAKNLINRKFPRILGEKEFNNATKEVSSFATFNPKIASHITSQHKNEFRRIVELKSKNYLPFISSREIFKYEENHDSSNLNISNCQEKACNITSCQEFCSHISEMNDQLLHEFLFEQDEKDKLIRKLKDKKEKLSNSLIKIIENNSIDNDKSTKISSDIIKEIKSIDGEIERLNNLKLDEINKHKHYYKFRIYDFENILTYTNS